MLDLICRKIGVHNCLKTENYRCRRCIFNMGLAGIKAMFGDYDNAYEEIDKVK